MPSMLNENLKFQWVTGGPLDQILKVACNCAPYFNHVLLYLGPFYLLYLTDFYDTIKIVCWKIEKEGTCVYSSWISFHVYELLVCFAVAVIGWVPIHSPEPDASFSSHFWQKNCSRTSLSHNNNLCSRNFCF